MEIKLEGSARWKRGTPVSMYVNHAYSYTDNDSPNGVRVHFTSIREGDLRYGVVIVTLTIEEARLLANKLSTIIGDVLT